MNLKNIFKFHYGLCSEFIMEFFSVDVSGLNGSQIFDKIKELASEYRLFDADEVKVEFTYSNKLVHTLHYDKINIERYLEMYDNPDDIFRSQGVNLGSDIKYEVFKTRKAINQNYEIVQVAIRGPQDIYDELMTRLESPRPPPIEEGADTPILSPQPPPIDEGPDTPILGPFPPPIEYDWKPHKRGGFFPYLLSHLYLTSNSDEARFIREEIDRCIAGNPTLNWAEDLQLLMFSHTDVIKRLLSERKKDENDELESVPIENECFSTPCILWALKDQITEEEYKELVNKQLIYGIKARIEEITKFLRDHGYNYVISKGRFCNATRFMKGTNGKTVELSYQEGHWMKKRLIRYFSSGRTRMVNIEVFLKKCLDQGLFRHLSAEELANAYMNFSFAAMKFTKKSIKETIDLLPENELVPFPDHWIKPISEIPFNPNRAFPKTVIFFDFEADTSSEVGHRPFLVCARLVTLKENGTWHTIGKKQAFWGKNCDKDFMEWVYKQFAIFHESKIRMYAFNARYDLTFIIKWLKNVNVCMRANKFYSIEGTYLYENGQNNSKKGKKIIEIWDAYLLFATSLRNAAKSSAEGGYLTAEQAKKIKKEMFPYNAYTFKYFEDHPDPWVNVEDMKVGFMEEDNEGKSYFNETKYDLFLETVRKLPDFYRYISNHDDEIESIQELFNYKAYAEFYCHQDVKCLMWIMLNMEDLCMGRTLEGVQGTPPFQIHIWNHRTASSIGYDNLQMNVFYKQDKTSQKWIPRHEFYALRNEGRDIIQQSIIGGRNMLGKNEKWHFKTNSSDPGEMLQDNDANSLYPSAMSKMWVTEGKPYLYKGKFTQEDFKAKFTHPWAPPGKENEKEFNDGVVHITFLNTPKKLDIPRMCNKDKEGKNYWHNFDHEEVDMWVNAKDLWDLVDYQNADFTWDVAAVYTGERHFEIQECISKLYNFRQPNKKHAIGNVTKLMMNSSYGKSTMKIVDEEAHIVDANEFPQYFRANSYRIKFFEKWATENTPLNAIKYYVKLYEKDTSPTNNIFGSNVLSMSKCVMMRPISIFEELGEKYHLNPHIYYTDTDSVHVLGKIVEEAKDIFKERYHYDMEGKGLCQFHNDFDIPKNFKKGEQVMGSNEFWGTGKKAYSDHLIGDQGSEGDHTRLKAVPSECIQPDFYPKLYAGETVEANVIGFGRVSFLYSNGEVISRRVMKRKIAFPDKRSRTPPITSEERPAKLRRCNADL